MTQPDWIAVDWGTSKLRAHAMGTGGATLERRQSDLGMGVLNQDGFEPALLALIDDWLAKDRKTDVICSGMVGAQEGWRQAPYRAVPCTAIDDSAGTKIETVDPRISVRVIAGLKQLRPADVMCGGETRIAGLLAAQPDFDGVVCLPGTHSRWAHISAAEVVSFQTFITGELFSLLAGQSVLRHSVGEDGWDDHSFLDALTDAISSPKMFAARLYSLRAQHLLADLPATSARARLSGLLIGLELAAARPYWLGQNVAIIGHTRLARIYEQALKAQGVAPVVLDDEQMTVAGLALAQGMLT